MKMLFQSQKFQCPKHTPKVAFPDLGSPEAKDLAFVKGMKTQSMKICVTKDVARLRARQTM